ncbi:MAG: hypothetical protein ABJH08_10355 [Balneola sp.]
MKISRALILLFVLLLQSQLFAQIGISYISEAEKDIFSNWEKSDFHQQTSYQQFLRATEETSLLSEFYQTHKAELQQKIRSRDNNKKKAEIIYDYLHKEVFTKYDLNARVADLFLNKTYNCVTATSFYVSMAEEFGIPFTIYETPSHVYAAVTHQNKDVIIELTSPSNGFDFGSNIEDLLQTLIDSKLISRDEVAEKGANQLYNEYVAQKNPISKKQLLGIQYHNEALILADQSRYEEAYNQMNKAVALYPNQVFSEAYKYIVTISQLDFMLNSSQNHALLSSLLVSTKNDSVLSYTMINYLGELVEDLLKFEENFELTAQLITDAENNITRDSFLDEKLQNYTVYMYTVFAQNASLKGETLSAKNHIEEALKLDPTNKRLITYYVSVTSSYATKLSQIGLFETARSTIDELASNYPEGYPIINESRVQVILDALISVPMNIENETKLLSEIKLAYSIQPDNIYLKSFSATVFHELAMQQIRNNNYEQAKALVLSGLSYNPSDATLRSDLDLINEILK